MGSEGLACIVGERHEPYEAGYPEGRTRHIFPTEKYEVRAYNKTEIR